MDDRSTESIRDLEAATTTPGQPALGTDPDRAFSSPTENRRIELPRGTRIYQYEIVRELGRGGMGHVFMARDTKLGRMVAIKFLIQTGELFVKRFLVEAQATARCTHENIVVIHDASSYEGHPFMVLEYLEGQTLSAIASAGPMPPSRVIEIAVPVARALTRAHRFGIVHRDLKLENVFVTDDGVVKVLDFGVAKLFGESRRSDPTEESGHRITSMRTPASVDDYQTLSEGNAVGTIQYMAPEQFGLDVVDERADLWALGVIMFILLAGEHPLGDAAGYAFAYSASQLDEQLRSIADIVPSVPDALAHIIDRCLRKRKADRYGAADELLADLERLAPSRRAYALAEHSCPYPGLSTFGEQDAERYFGRDREIARAMALLREHPLLAVVGPSGAGKSSFVRAGVVPALREADPGWEIISLRPGRDPLKTLISAIVPSSSDLVAAEERARGEPGWLAALLRDRSRSKGARILVFVDQFEELYTLGCQPRDRSAYANALQAIADDASSPLRVVLSLRSDFLHRLDECSELARSVTRALMLFGSPDAQALRSAVVAPAETAGYHFETPRMVDQMIEQVSASAASYPLLQFCLTQLWSYRDRAKRTIPESALTAIGGFAGALAAHADNTIAALPERGQRIARSICQRLVTSDGTRAIVDVAELWGEDRSAAELVLGALTDARLLVVHQDVGTVELAHESLVTEWPTLHRWTEQGREDTLFFEQVRAAAHQWHAHGRPAGLLWRGAAFGDARRFLARFEGTLAGLERAFLDACRRAEYRRRTWIRGAVAVGAAVALAVILVLWSANGRVKRAAASERAELLAEWRERGRQELLAGHAASALRWLDRVAESGPSDPALSFMMSRAVDLLAPRGTVLVGHKRQVRDVAFSVDGTHVVTCSDDGTAILWDVASDAAVRTFAHGAPVSNVALSADGSKLATSAADGLRVWDTRDGKELARVSHGRLGPLAWIDEDRALVIAAGSATLIYSMTSGVARELPNTSGEQLALSADKRRLAIGADDRVVVLALPSADVLVRSQAIDSVRFAALDAAGDHIAVVTSSEVYYKESHITILDRNGKTERAFDEEDRVTSIAFSPDGKRVLTGSRDRTAKVWDVATGTIAFSLAENAAISRAVYTPDGTKIITISGDGTSHLWDGRDGTPLLQLEGHTASVTAAAFSSDGTHLVTGSWDATARLWDISKTPIALSLAPRTERGARLWSARFSPNGALIATSDSFGYVRTWDAKTGELLRTFSVPDMAAHIWNEAYWTAFSPAGDRLAVTFDDQNRETRIYRVADGQVLATLRGHSERPWTVEWSPDGAHLVTASWDHTAAIWDASTGVREHVLAGHSDVLWQAVYSPDGSLVATASDDATCKLWEAATGKLLATLEGHASGVSTVAFSADGKLLATGSRDRTVHVWDVATRRIISTMTGHTDAVNLVSFSPDGAFVITAGFDGRARVFDTASGVLLTTLESHRTPANGAEPSRDGRFVLTVGSFDDRVKLWRLDLRHQAPDPAIVRRLLDSP